MLSKFCPNCGHPIKPGQEFCPNCGQRLGAAQPKTMTNAANRINRNRQPMYRRPPFPPRRHHSWLGSIISLVVILVMILCYVVYHQRRPIQKKLETKTINKTSRSSSKPKAKNHHSKQQKLPYESKNGKQSSDSDSDSDNSSSDSDSDSDSDSSSNSDSDSDSDNNSDSDSDNNNSDSDSDSNSDSDSDSSNSDSDSDDQSYHVGHNQVIDLADQPTGHVSYTLHKHTIVLRVRLSGKTRMRFYHIKHISRYRDHTIKVIVVKNGHYGHFTLRNGEVHHHEQTA